MKAPRKPRLRKFSSLMSEPVLKALREQAAHNGQSFYYVLETAAKLYLELAASSTPKVRPNVMRVADEVIAENIGLLKRLAKMS
jgi:hypothetical protein